MLPGCRRGYYRRFFRVVPLTYTRGRTWLWESLLKMHARIRIAAQAMSTRGNVAGLLSFRGLHSVTGQDFATLLQGWRFIQGTQCLVSRTQWHRFVSGVNRWMYICIMSNVGYNMKALCYARQNITSNGNFDQDMRRMNHGTEITCLLRVIRWRDHFRKTTISYQYTSDALYFNRF